MLAAASRGLIKLQHIPSCCQGMKLVHAKCWSLEVCTPAPRRCLVRSISELSAPACQLRDWTATVQTRLGPLPVACGCVSLDSIQVLRWLVCHSFCTLPVCRLPGCLCIRNPGLVYQGPLRCLKADVRRIEPEQQERSDRTPCLAEIRLARIVME